MPDEVLSPAELRRQLGLPAPGADRQAPPRARPVQRELSLQMASAEWLDALEWIGPRPVWTHIPNERRSLLEAVRMKRCGVRKGVPDWLFWLPGGRTLSIELKAREAARAEQRAVRDELEALGHPWRLCRSIDEMAKAMLEQGLEFRETAMAAAIRRTWM